MKTKNDFKQNLFGYFISWQLICFNKTYLLPYFSLILFFFFFFVKEIFINFCKRSANEKSSKEIEEKVC